MGQLWCFVLSFVFRSFVITIKLGSLVCKTSCCGLKRIGHDEIFKKFLNLCYTSKLVKMGRNKLVSEPRFEGFERG
ncbi:hypothetical protein Hanom_Chr01g00074121 [Helianthus anomalus]